jgi:hypothetical protein
MLLQKTRRRRTAQVAGRTRLSGLFETATNVCRKRSRTSPSGSRDSTFRSAFRPRHSGPSIAELPGQIVVQVLRCDPTEQLVMTSLYNIQRCHGGNNIRANPRLMTIPICHQSQGNKSHPNICKKPATM